MNGGLTRRDFLKNSAAAGLAIGVAPTIMPWRGAARDQVNVGIIGLGWRGADHVREVAQIPTANIIALCDVDENTLADQGKRVPGATRYIDFREMLRHPRLDAVVVATPDHNHAIACAASMRAGKHVLCE